MIKGIIQRLISNADIANRIGQNRAGNRVKIYPVVCPQEEKYPYIVLRKESERINYCVQEISGKDILIEIKLYNDEYEFLDDIEALIEDQISLYKGTSADVVIKNTFKTNSYDSFDNDTDNFVRIINYTMVL